MGIFCKCIICKSTVDFNKIKDSSEHMICEKCLNKVPNHVPNHVPKSQQHDWLQRIKK